MKKSILIAACFILLTIQPRYIPADELITSQVTAIQVVTATTNATALAVDTSSWTACDLWTTIPERFNTTEVMFYAWGDGSAHGNPDGGTFSYSIYVAAKYGNAELVASGTAIVGKSQMSHNPVSTAQLNSGAVDSDYCWVDTLGAVTSDWLPTPSPGNDGGLDGVASLTFDSKGRNKITCIITGITNLSQVWCIAYGH